MMRRWIHLLFFLCFFLCFLDFQQAWAEGSDDENSDLNLIPGTLESPTENKTPPDRTSALSGKAFIEDSLTVWSNRRRLLVPAPIQNPSWQNRTSLDLDYKWQFDERTGFSLSDRLNGYEGNTIPFPSNGNARNDFREGLLSYEVFPGTYLEAGRINIKNGTALGYNPTDFLKTRTKVDIVSIDPSALKEDRLGTVMIDGQRLWDNGSLTLAFAPKLQTETPLLLTPAASFDPLFGQTNSANRFLASLSYDIAGLSPQALLFVDGTGTHVGVNLSRVMSSSVVAYVEWSGVSEANLTDRAVAFGKDTGTLPGGAPAVPQSESSVTFQNDLAFGASWTSSSNLTINLEYHYHQAGFNGADFNRWISLGNANSTSARELWFVRQYAVDQQEPLMQHEFFVRFDYPDVIQSKLNLGAVAFISPYDGSVLAQASAQYFLSRKLTFGAYLSGALGSLRSEQGSLPWSTSVVFQAVWYP
jgi:hypothetical protein